MVDGWKARHVHVPEGTGKVFFVVQRPAAPAIPLAGTIFHWFTAQTTMTHRTKELLAIIDTKGGKERKRERERERERASSQVLILNK